MKTFLTLLILLFFISCSQTKQPEEKQQIIELTHIAWACDCADWAYASDIQKYYSEGDILAALSIWIEPANPSLELPDTLGFNGDVIKLTGQFYPEKGFPKGHRSFEDPEEARVFRYTAYEVVKSNYQEPAPINMAVNTGKIETITLKPDYHLPFYIGQ